MELMMMSSIITRNLQSTTLYSLRDFNPKEVHLPSDKSPYNY